MWQAHLASGNFADADHFTPHKGQFRLRRLGPDVQVDLLSVEAARRPLPRHGAIGGGAQHEYHCNETRQADRQVHHGLRLSMLTATPHSILERIEKQSPAHRPVAGSW